MKRSEMLDVIAYCISHTSHLDMAVHGDSNYKELARELLCLIENKGMLPPETKATPDDFANTGFTFDFLADHNFRVNRWDDE